MERRRRPVACPLWARRASAVDGNRQHRHALAAAHRFGRVHEAPGFNSECAAGAQFAAFDRSIEPIHEECRPRTTRRALVIEADENVDRVLGVVGMRPEVVEVLAGM